MPKKFAGGKALILLAALLALFAAVGAAGESGTSASATQPRTRYFTGEHRSGQNGYRDDAPDQ